MTLWILVHHNYPTQQGHHSFLLRHNVTIEEKRACRPECLNDDINPHQRIRQMSLPANGNLYRSCGRKDRIIIVPLHIEIPTSLMDIWMHRHLLPESSILCG